MTGLRFSEEVMARDEFTSEETEYIEMLMSATEDTEAVVSDGDLNHVRMYLDKVGGPSQVNHDLLQTVFKRLQAWALSPALSKLLEIGIVQNLATIYDSFIQTDHSTSEVLRSTLELLFVIEDMSDSSEGKIQCGKLFLFRLLALATATAESLSVKLQRAAVETICALVTRSPENQQAVLDQKAQCYKLFKIFLPRCGDFQLMASITEIFYRLAKRGPPLLEFMPNKAARKSMESLLQSKHPDLLSDIRTIVTLINESVGHGRSVYSFLAERILINGQIMNTADNWVNFGRTQLSFYIGHTELNIAEPSMMDVQYEDILEIKRSSPTLVDVLVLDRPAESSVKALGLESGQSTVIHIQMHFNVTDSSAIEANVLPETLARTIERQGKLTSRTHFVDASTSKGSKGGPVNFNKTIQPTNGSTLPGKEVSPAGDRLLPERAEHCYPNDKSGFDCIQNSPDYVSDTPQDVDTPARAANAPGQSLTIDEARSKRNQTLQGTITDGSKSCKPPGRHANDYCQPQVTSLSSTFQRFNPLGPYGQSFQRKQDDHRLQNSNMEAADEYQSTSLVPPADSQTDIRFRKVSKDGDEICENRRTSRPSHLITQNLKELSGPKTKSPSDENLPARVTETDDETTDEINDEGLVRELRMKQRQDPQHTNGIPALEAPRQIGKSNLVRNICHQVNNAELPEAQRCNLAAGRDLMTPPRDMLASDSVMTDIREKRVRNGKGTKTCRGRSSKAVLKSAAGQGENGEKNVCRTLRKRTCKKPTSYFDADDEHTSDGSTEFVVTRKKKSSEKSSGIVTDPILNKDAKRSTQTITKSERRAVAQGNRVSSVSHRNGPLPAEHPCGQKASTISFSRERTFSIQRKANHDRKVPCASISREDVVEDVFCFTAEPEEERQSRKTASALGSKVKRNSDYTEPCRKRRKKPEAESHHLMSIARQRSCTSDGPRPGIPVKTPAKVKKSPPRASPAGCPPGTQEEVTPQQQGQGNVGLFSDSDHPPRPPVLQARKTYTKSDRTITRNSRLERWKSFSIRKLELPTVDAASPDESSDEETRKTSYVKGIEVEDVAAESDDSSGIIRIATLLKNFKQKVKLVEKKTMGDILSNTTQRIQHEIQSAEEQVRGEKTDFMDSCKKRCGQLDNELQGHIKVMQETYEKYQMDFAQHLKRHDVLVGEIEGTELELNDLAKQQGHEHKEVVAKLNDSCQRLLAEADKKLLKVGKSSTGMRGLKEALQGIFREL